MWTLRALKKVVRVRSRSTRQALEDAVWDVQEAVARYDRLAARVAREDSRTREKLLYMLTT